MTKRQVHEELFQNIHVLTIPVVKSEALSPGIGWNSSCATYQWHELDLEQVI